MKISTYLLATARAVKVFAGDVAGGFLKVSHHGIALLGLAVLAGAAALVLQPQWRHEGEARLTAWLTARKVAAQGLAPEPVPRAIERATAANPGALPPEQASVALWIAHKYHVAPEPLAALVSEAYAAGRSNHIDPALILAVMGVESGFNPFAQSPVGAQGLMQVMTQVHSDKYRPFGGRYAAFDPKTNLRVGAKVLKDCIDRAGSVRGGLKYYVGAPGSSAGNGYAARVMAEYARLYQVANGAPPPADTPAPVTKAAMLTMPVGGKGAAVKVAALQ